MLLHLVVNLLLLWITYVNGNLCNEGCANCLGDKRCDRCERGYVLKTNSYAAECFKCPSKCTACTRNGDCQSCKPTFFGTKCEQSCSLCENYECNNYGCVNGCKSGYYLDQNRYDICEKCSYRCTECTTKYTCSSCDTGWFGDGCRYSCTPCSQCVSVSCTKDCREYEYPDYRCANVKNKRCPNKCSMDFSGPRRNTIVSSTIKTPTTLTTTTTITTTPTTTTTTPATTTTTLATTTTTLATTTTTPKTTTTTPTTTTTTPTTTTTTPATTTTTLSTTTTTPATATTTLSTTTTTPTTTSTTPTTTTTTPTTPTPKPSDKPTNIQTTQNPTTRRPLTHATSNIFSSPKPTTPQENEDTETTTQHILPTEGDKNVSPKTQSEGSDSPTLYIVIAVIGVSVLVGVIVVVIYLKRRKRGSRRGQMSSSSDTEEYTYAKQNKVRKMDSQTGMSNEMDLQRPNKDPSSISSSEQGLGQSDPVLSNATSHVTDTTSGIDGIILETCLDESETAATEANSSTRQSMDDDTYYNVLSFQRNKVKVDKFEGYVKSKSSFDFNTEFQKFPKGLCRPYTHAKKPENMVKCRYYDVCPYDTNRVKLLGKDNDFINASYIDGYSGQNEYIASLGPTNATMANFVDFWAMVWQDNVEKIVMLTKLVEGTTIKCEQYWPEIGKTISYGDVIVTNKSDDVYTDYTIRTLSVKKGTTTRRVFQAHFLSWPDKRVPERMDVFLIFRDQVRALKSEMDGPLVVHCSAGVGRTGTYIAIDILLQQLTEEGAVDVFGCVIGIRGQRVAMVQTKEQYEFIHNVLVESIRKTK